MSSLRRCYVGSQNMLKNSCHVQIVGGFTQHRRAAASPVYESSRSGNATEMVPSQRLDEGNKGDACLLVELW